MFTEEPPNKSRVEQAWGELPREIASDSPLLTALLAHVIVRTNTDLAAVAHASP